MVATRENENEKPTASNVDSQPDDDRSVFSKYPKAILTDAPTSIDSDGSESSGGLTEVQKAEINRHDAVTSLLKVFKILSVIVPVFAAIGIAIWGYRVGNVAEPIGYLKSEMSNLKEVVAQLSNKVDENNEDLIRLKTLTEIRQQDGMQQQSPR